MCQHEPGDVVDLRAKTTSAHSNALVHVITGVVLRHLVDMHTLFHVSRTHKAVLGKVFTYGCMSQGVRCRVSGVGRRGWDEPSP